MFLASSTVPSTSRDINSECHITARSTATLRERRFAPSLVRVIADVRWLEMTLFLKNLLFTLVVPGTFAVYFPLGIAQDRSASLGVGFVAG